MPSTFQTAGLQGGKPLGPKKSFHSTRGLVVGTGPFTLTADYIPVRRRRPTGYRCRTS